MQQAASPLRDGTRRVGRCPLPHAPISQGVGPAEAGVHSTSPSVPPVWTSKGQGCQAQCGAHQPLGWRVFQSSDLGTTMPATSVTGLSSEQD